MLDNILEVTEIAPLTYVNNAHQENFRHALFGGQVVAQALNAACKTVENLQPHSLHAYFLRPGSTLEPVTYTVEITRDGKSVSNRYVKAQQNGKDIYTMMCSFHQQEKGFEHQFVRPQNCISPQELLKKLDPSMPPMTQDVAECIGAAPIDYVAYDRTLFERDVQNHANARFWFKSKTPLKNITNQYAAIAFASDIGLLATSLLAHNTSLFCGDVIPASMDHAVWFHSTPRFEQWHQFVTESPWANHARALCLGHIFNQDGELVATVSQEGMIRSNTFQNS